MGENDRGEQEGGLAAGGGPLELGRRAYSRRAWEDAYRQFFLADSEALLGAEDLERLAMSAYLSGRDEVYLHTLDRAHHAHLVDGNGVRAARCAFWLGLRLAFRGETGPATGWFGRARRLLQREGRVCVEEGYLLLPAAEGELRAGHADAAHATAARAAEIGDRFGEADLSACARHVQGRALLLRGQSENGLALLDEAMVAVIAGELSPIMTGLIYCSVVEVCQQVCAVDRARDWTAALANWCSRQPQLVAFTGTCLVHRAEVMQLHGAWQDALEEARRACAVSGGSVQRPPAAAYYQQAEVHRLRGAFREAAEAYRQASRQGSEPQPGLALLRLAQGRKTVAATMIRRVERTATDRLQRARLLPAYVEIMLAAGAREEAGAGCRELEEAAETIGTVLLRAMAAHARGAVALAEGTPQAALRALRSAFDLWRQVKAPYLAARTRELVGYACRTLGDAESAALELDAARAAFEELGASPDVARLDSRQQDASAARGVGLTPRELQVLRLVAAGKSNKAIAAELGRSEKTIDRHLANIFNKLDVPSRTAAAAWAYERRLV